MHTYHSNSKTNIHVRQHIRENPDGLTMRQLAERFQVAVGTVHRWRHREGCLADASCRPNDRKEAFTPEQQAIILHLRRQAQLSLDDLFDAVEPICPKLNRSSLYRLLRRNAEQRRSKQGTSESPAGSFDPTITPGYLHIDSFVLWCLSGQSNRPSERQHCFVAIDRATRLVLLGVYDTYGSEAACDFLERCRAFFPFTLHTILTDNGGQYTLKGSAPRKHASGHRRPFEQLCLKYQIHHKTTRPYTPKTNGMVERVNGLIRSALDKQPRYTNTEHRDEALYAWARHYNFERKHRRIPLGRMTPYQAAERWYQTRPELFAKRPDLTILRAKLCSQPRET